MNITFAIIIGMLILSIASPFLALYAVSLSKKKKYIEHIKIQKALFWVCIAGLLLLEVQIRVSGGSGSLVSNNKYTSTNFFKYTLISHIVGAVITYIIWGITVFRSNAKWKKKNSSTKVFFRSHKALGIITIVGLFYIAITALIVTTMAFFL